MVCPGDLVPGLPQLRLCILLTVCEGTTWSWMQVGRPWQLSRGVPALNRFWNLLMDIRIRMWSLPEILKERHKLVDIEQRFNQFSHRHRDLPSWSTTLG